MGVTVGPFRLVVGWPELAVLAIVAAVAAGWLDRRAGGGWGALWRAAGVGLVVAALARPSLDRGGAEALVVAVDRSTSVAAGAADAALAAVHAARPDAGVMPFGDAAGSPVAGALDTVARALPAGGVALLMTDGGSTDAGAEAAAARAYANGVRVDVVPLPPAPGVDAAIDAVEAPAAVYAGQAFPVTVYARASSPVSATLTLMADGRRVAAATVGVGPGGAARTWTYAVDRPGGVRLSATLSAEPDREPGNDTAFAAVHAAPPARVLVVGEGAGAVGLADRLAGAGLAPTVVGPDRVPGRLSRLAAWDALVLVDTPAQALGLDQLAAIEAFVADLGRGVVLTGGRQSFAAGGWHGTVLAEMAPVSLDPPPREEREPVALVLMIDQSASMGSIEGRGDLTKLDLAREAAALAAEVLHPGDTLGVVAYDDGARWLVPPARVEAGLALAEVERRLAGLTTGGGTRIRAALELGLPALARLEDVPTRHAVLLSDGRDFDPEADHAREVLAAQAAGVTLSAIAIGSDVDRALLGRLAQLGRGRFHVAAEPADLPRLAVEESAIVRARSEQTGAFRAAAAAGAPHPALAGVDVAALPELTGYLALRARPGGGLALEAPNRDPLLAAWQYGRGRVAAWTSDVGEAWAGAWAGDAAAAAFWARLAYYVARVPDAGPPGVAVAWDGPRARVDVDAVDGDGRAVDLARVSLTITGTDAARTVDLHQTAPGRYAADIALDRPGAYPATVSLARPTDAARSGRDGAPAFPPAAVPVALAWSYPAELRVGADGDRTLASIARAGGGQVRSALDPVPPAGAGGRIELWPWLLGAAAGLWVFDVARQMGMMDGLSRRPSRAR